MFTNKGDEIDRYILGILQLRWHHEPKRKYYFHDSIHLENMNYTPCNADSNHGCVIIDARDIKDVRASFYNQDGRGIPVENFKEIDNIKIVKNVFDRLDENDYKQLIEDMNKKAQEQVLKRLER